MSLPRDLSSPASRAIAVTPNNDADLPVLARSLWIGGAGAVRVILADDTDPVTISAIPAGTLLPVIVKRVLATGTTATAIVGLC